MCLSGRLKIDEALQRPLGFNAHFVSLVTPHHWLMVSEATLLTMPIS